MSQTRLHEVAKALGQTSKVLMAELAKEGHEFKTHMATLEEPVMTLLHSRYPELQTKLTALKAEAAAAPKEAKEKKTGKPVTSKSKKGAKGESSDESEAPSVEILQRDEGQAGTVTLEQRVVKEGVVRRRRVEPTPAPAPVAAAPTTPAPQVPPVASAPAEVAAPQVPPAPTRPPMQLSSTAPMIKRVAPTPPPAPIVRPAAPPAPKPAVPSESLAAEPPPAAPVSSSASPSTPPTASVVPPMAKTVTVQPPPPRPAPRPTIPPLTGRNLSAPSRLRIIETPTTPPPLPPGLNRPRPNTPTAPAAARPETRARTFGAPAAPTESEAERAKASAKKKPAARGVGETEKVTKHALLGMMEEVEITRPLGRRAKKPTARLEKKATQLTTPGASKRKIRIHDEVTVSDLADQMGLKGAELVRKLISMGQMASLSQKLDFETASLIASDYKYEVLNVAESAANVLQADLEAEEKGEQIHRAPIVTIMGHVDHGKTSLLDYIRRTRVAAGEAGGITQHIGAYQIQHNGKTIAFLDTPGHAAFTAMRARGASLTDIVILVVAADEGVKPQTLEALAHAQSAGVPIIVAVNKMDKPEAKPDNVIQELSGKGLVPEAWGGETIYSKVSAKTGDGVNELLEMILLQAEVLDLKVVADKGARGTVIESRLDKGKGPVATVMVQSGTLRQGDPVVSGTTFGKVRALFNDQGKMVSEAGPSTPVEVLGFDSVPSVGEIVSGVSEDAIARKASELSVLAKKHTEAMKASRLSLEEMYKKMQAGEVSDLRVILKGDVQGSIEAISDSLEKIKHDKVKVSVIFKAVGGITESDVDLAAASGAIIFGFNVRPTNQAKALAARENVQIKSYEIIYELMDDVKLAMQGLLAPIIKENVLGQAEVRDVFNVSKVGPIAGCYVKSGKIVRSGNVRVIRDSVVVYTAKIGSLRRFKDDAKEVAEGFECGIRVENFMDLKTGDILECFETIEMKQAI